MTTSMQRMLCLAMTVLGPLTNKTPTEKTKQEVSSDEGSPLALLLGRSFGSVFSCVEWKTLKTMATTFGSFERCLQWLGMTISIPEEDVPCLKAGAEALKEWEGETDALTKDLKNVQQELEMVRAKCLELTAENSELREKCETYSEAGIILEQDRQQLQRLLTDKCKLVEENQHLEREISSLHELLEYATEHAINDEEAFDGETSVVCAEDLSGDDVSFNDAYSVSLEDEDRRWELNWDQED